MSKRPSLASFPPKPVTAPAAKADNARIEESAAAAPAPAPAQSHSAKYPKVSVYLTADEIRTLKLLGIENGQRVNDICAAAIREWLQRHGHARGTHFEA